mmetsp:Transcript_21948/g.56444  ORF Transcript_21948/g.56444 Transcript_21948/m.56444 type:complete len:253 (+) Transcript_21948:134-892(+)
MDKDKSNLHHWASRPRVEARALFGALDVEVSAALPRPKRGLLCGRADHAVEERQREVGAKGHLRLVTVGAEIMLRGVAGFLAYLSVVRHAGAVHIVRVQFHRAKWVLHHHQLHLRQWHLVVVEAPIDNKAHLPEAQIQLEACVVTREVVAAGEGRVGRIHAKVDPQALHVRRVALGGGSVRRKSLLARHVDLCVLHSPVPDALVDNGGHRPGHGDECRVGIDDDLRCPVHVLRALPSLRVERASVPHMDSCA